MVVHFNTAEMRHYRGWEVLSLFCLCPKKVRRPKWSMSAMLESSDKKKRTSSITEKNEKNHTCPACRAVQQHISLKQWRVCNEYSLLLLHTITSKRMRWGGVKRQARNPPSLADKKRKKKKGGRKKKKSQNILSMDALFDKNLYTESKVKWWKRGKLMNFKGVYLVLACTLGILRHKVGSTFGYQTLQILWTEMKKSWQTNYV